MTQSDRLKVIYTDDLDELRTSPFTSIVWYRFFFSSNSESTYLSCDEEGESKVGKYNQKFIPILETLTVTFIDSTRQQVLAPLGVRD